MAVVARKTSLDSVRDASFSHNDDNPPHWFKPERFVEPHFDAESYVADLRRYVGLITIIFKSISACGMCTLQIPENIFTLVTPEYVLGIDSR